MPYKYIGRTTDFCGKTLWEIVGNLQNFGVGRLITRTKYERYPEISFMKIMKVEALPNPKNPSIDDVRKVRVFVERTFRGIKATHLINIESASYKADYKLVPKHEEHKFLDVEVQKKKLLLPKYMEYPPLLKAYLMRESPNQNPDDLKVEVVYNKHVNVAQDGETPTTYIPNTLTTEYAPDLYKDVKAI